MAKTIIFDVDGTLLNTERIYMRAWVEAGKDFGYQIPDIALLQTRAVNKKEAEACFKRHCGQDFPYEDIRLARVDVSEKIIENTPAAELLMPQAEELLRWLKDGGYTVAAASSTEIGKTKSHLEHAGLLGYFDVVVGGDMVTRGKPNPDIFLKAAEMAGAAIENCLVVGDSPADVFAAHGAGMKMVLIPDQVPANEKTSPLCWKIYEGLGQVMDAVGEWEA